MTFGFFIPYLAVIVLFCYLVTLISQRKTNKVSNKDDLHNIYGKTSDEVLTEPRSKFDSYSGSSV